MWMRRCRSGLREEKTPSAISVLGRSKANASLSEEGGLLITGDSGDGNAGRKRTWCGRLSDYTAGGYHFR